MTKYIVTEDPDQNFQDVRVFVVKERDAPEYDSPTYVWWDSGKPYCVNCSGPVSAMLSSCKHSQAVRRHMEKLEPRPVTLKHSTVMSHHTTPSMERRHAELMNDLNNMLIRIKLSLYPISGNDTAVDMTVAGAQHHYPPPSNKELDDLQRRINAALTENDKPMKR